MELIPMWDMDSDKTPQWEFYAIQHKTNCLKEFEALLDNRLTQKHTLQLIKTINALCFHDEGPKLYINNSNICHEAVAGERIYSFRKGNVRLYWFYGQDRRVVICPMVLVKREQKTSRDIANKLIKFKTSYFEAKQNQNITYKK